MLGPFMLQALVSGFGTGAKEAAFWNRGDQRRGKGTLFCRMFPALVILLWKRWFCPRRMATTQQKSAGRK